MAYRLVSSMLQVLVLSKKPHRLLNILIRKEEMKKIYIEPSVKAVKIILPTILAGSITNPDTGYSTNDNEEINPDDPNPIDAGQGL